MERVRILIRTHRKLVVMLLSIFYILLLLVWIPGLGATIMMSDSFSINDSRSDYVMLLIFLWGTIPFTIIGSFFFLRWKKNVVYYFIPLSQILLFILLFFTFPLFSENNDYSTITSEQYQDLNLLLAR